MKNHNKFWIVLSLIVVFAAGFFGGILFEDYILDKKAKQRPPRKSSVRFPTLEIMAEELTLTPEQQEQIREIFNNNEKRIKNLRSEIHERYSGMRTQLRNEIKSVLTEEQNLKFDAMIEKYVSHRRKELEGRKKYPGKRNEKKGDHK